MIENMNTADSIAAMPRTPADTLRSKSIAIVCGAERAPAAGEAPKDASLT
jgi:hypothetical protein